MLYALSAADLTMVLALVFFLARNIVKLFVERRRGLPFSRFRAKLVMALLGLTIIPSVLVLLVGGELIRSSTQLWFSQPVDDVLRSAVEIGGDYYREHEGVVGAHARTDCAQRSGGRGPGGRRRRGAQRPLPRKSRRAGLASSRFTGVEPGGGAQPLVAVESPALPRGHVRALADRLADEGGVGEFGSPDRGAARRRRRARPRRGDRPRRRRIARSASSSRAIRFAATSRCTPGGSPMRTRTTASCVSFAGRSRASTCRSS